jgi:uncharacterized protein YaiE (UPF0345 family)
MNARCANLTFDGATEEDPNVVLGACRPVLQNEVDYLMWRAQHERMLAARALSAKVAVTHRYLAAAYAARIYEVTEIPSELQELLDKLA